MFLFKASSYLEELKKHRPDSYEACQFSMQSTLTDNDILRVNELTFDACPSDSIDYAVMEKTDDAVVVPMDARWFDIGSWLSLWDICEKGVNGNAIYDDVMLRNSEGRYVRYEARLVDVVGLDDVVTVGTKDALMVAHKESVQDAKIIAQQLKSDQRSEWDLHREEYLPWGKSDFIDNDSNYQVKKLTVNSGAKLSVQMHYHRSEHWVVVAGQARAYYGNQSHDLSTNESACHGK
jgi:mannose-1-phosphate guanylyltransferase